MSELEVSQVWAAARRDAALLAANQENPHLLLRGRAVMMLTGGPTADFNVALLDAGPDDEALLHEFVSRTHAANVQALFMFSSDCARRLGAVAREAGLVEAGSAPLMVLTAFSAEPVQTVAYSVERVADPGRLELVRDLVASANGLDSSWVGRTFAARSYLGVPGISHFLATKEGEAYSAVMTTMSKGPVGIWSMASAPDRQRQGAGRAVLEAAMAHHRALGADAFYLIATPAGKPLYDALGFKTVDDVSIWIAGHSEQFAAADGA